MDEYNYALMANQASSHFCARLLSHEDEDRTAS